MVSLPDQLSVLNKAEPAQPGLAPRVPGACLYGTVKIHALFLSTWALAGDCLGHASIFLSVKWAAHQASAMAPWTG